MLACDSWATIAPELFVSGCMGRGPDAAWLTNVSPWTQEFCKNSKKKFAVKAGGKTAASRGVELL